MSAPNTNIETQKERHQGPLIGMRAAIIWAGVLLALLVVWTVYNGNTPEETGAQVEVAPGQGAVVAND